jgi:hypothetical protein
MSKPTFADFLKQAHAIVHEPEAAPDPSHVFNIGYALGKLTAHYKKKMSDQEAEDFDRGMLDGYAVGHLARLQ